VQARGGALNGKGREEERKRVGEGGGREY